MGFYVIIIAIGKILVITLAGATIHFYYVLTTHHRKWGSILTFLSSKFESWLDDERKNVGPVENHQFWTTLQGRRIFFSFFKLPWLVCKTKSPTRGISTNLVFHKPNCFAFPLGGMIFVPMIVHQSIELDDRISKRLFVIRLYWWAIRGRQAQHALCFWHHPCL